jgi:hypothetical protein
MCLTPPWGFHFNPGKSLSSNTLATGSASPLRAQGQERTESWLPKKEGIPECEATTGYSGGDL